MVLEKQNAACRIATAGRVVSHVRY